MIKEKSCGTVVAHKTEKGYEFLLLHYPGGHWDLPKGHVEEGEKEIETALRELEEETGIQKVDLVDGYRETIQYFFRKPEGKIDKEVVFFLVTVGDKGVQISHEHKNSVWLSYDEAYKKVTFQNAKDLIKKANDSLA